jgi:hypothetical protein
MFESMYSTLSKVKKRQVKGNVVDDDVFKVGTKEWSKQKMLFDFFTRIHTLSSLLCLELCFDFLETFLISM